MSQTCARLSRENAELHDRVSRLMTGTGVPAPQPAGAVLGGQRAAPLDGRAAPLDGTVSRRMIGRALGAAAVGVVGGAALVEAGARPAAASDGNNIVAGNTTTAESATTLQFDGSSNPGMIFLVNDTNFGAGSSSHPAAVGGWAGGDVANGVYGFTEVEGSDGVVGQVGFGNTTGNGVHALAAGASVVGVFAENSAGTAVSGNSDSIAADATAILGTITSTAPGPSSAGVRGVNNGTAGNGIGVWGSQAGSGWGVYGTSAHGIGVNANSGNGVGVNASGGTGMTASGTSAGVIASGPTGVKAIGSGTNGVGVSASATGSGGRGGVFAGSAAQVQLTPGSNSTHPTSGKRGDLYADSTGRLWFCKKSGSTATWHQIA